AGLSPAVTVAVAGVPGRVGRVRNSAGRTSALAPVATLTLPLHTSLCGAATTTWCSPPGTSMRSGTTPATYSCPSTPTCDPAGACTTSVDVAGAGTAGFGAGAGATAA